MTTSTRRTFTSGYEGPTVSDSVKLSQSARDRALATQTQGLERDRQRQQQQAQTAQATAFYRGGGEYSTLGAEGGYRPRGTVTSGGAATGARVPSNNGLMGGMPAPIGGDDEALLVTAERLGNVALERGPQVGSHRPTPNLIDERNFETDVFPRYPQDRYYQTTTRQTWQWAPATDTDEGYYWDVAAPADLLPVGVESPAVEQYPALVGNDVRRRIESVFAVNYLPDGAPGDQGTVELISSGFPVTLGETLLDVGGYLMLSVTVPGTGRLIATIELRQI